MGRSFSLKISVIFLLLTLALLLNISPFKDLSLLRSIRFQSGYIFSPFRIFFRRDHSDYEKILAAYQLTFQGLEKENLSLREALKLKRRKARSLHLLSADVIGYNPTSWHQSVLINLGKRDGLAGGEAVINEVGLVGRVREVFPHTSLVLLLIDPLSSLSVRLERGRVLGLLKGEGPGRLSLNYLPVGIKINDRERVVTSGLSKKIPPGIAVARLKEVKRRDADLFLEVELEPLVNFYALERVFVVKP